MWAASTIPSLRPSCPPNFFSSTTTTTSAKPRQACLTAGAVSAKFRGGPWRRRKKDDKYSSDTFPSDEDEDEDEGDINWGRSQVVVDPLPNKTPIVSSGSNHHHHRKLFKGQEEEEEEEEEPKPDRQLSGSDVLWALRRATAHKYNKKKKTTMTSSSSSFALSNKSKSDSNTQRQQQHDEEDCNIIDYSNARAISIKSEWTSRLDELDKRLHHLIHT